MRDYLPMNARRRATVLDIVNEKSAGSPADAQAWLAGMRAHGRYVEDS
jgi:hypothetical protein